MAITGLGVGIVGGKDRVPCIAKETFDFMDRVKYFDLYEGGLGWKRFKVFKNGPQSWKKRTTVTHPDFHTWWMASGRSSCSVLSGNNNCRSWDVHIQLYEEHFVPATRCAVGDEQCSLPHVRSSVCHLRGDLLFHNRSQEIYKPQLQI